MEMSNERSSIQPTLRDIFHILFKHKKKIILFFAAIMVLTVMATLAATRIYQSEAKLYVRLGKETVTMNPGLGQVVQISQSLQNQINSEIEMLKNPELALGVVNQLGMEAFGENVEKYAVETDSLTAKLRQAVFVKLVSFPKNAIARLITDEEPGKEAAGYKKQRALAEKIRQNLEIKAQGESNIISLSYRNSHPDRAYDVLKEYIDVYQEKHLQVHGSPKSFDFFEKESQKFRELLEESEQELKDLKNEIGVGNLEEQRQILSAQIGALDQGLEETRSEAASARAKIKSLKTRLEIMPEMSVTSETTGAPSSALDELHSQLYSLKLREQELLSMYTEDSVPVREVRRQIQEAGRLLAEAKDIRQITRGANQMREVAKQALMETEGSLDALQAKEASQQQQLNHLQNRLRELNTAELRINKLERKRELLQENYQRYSNSFEQNRIDKAREMEKISNINVAQPPDIPIEPILPKTRLNLIIGFFLALFGSISLAFLVEYVDDRIDKPQQVEQSLDLPVLGSIQKWEK
jgi:uncharacterized protein involved in exopolysaccharide biosynthesis